MATSIELSCSQFGSQLRASCYYYGLRNYQPVWIQTKDSNQKIDNYLYLLREIKNEGLNPSEYNITTIKSLKKQSPINKGLLELTTSQSFYKLIRDIYMGHRTYSSDPDWSIEPQPFNFRQILNKLSHKSPLQVVTQALPQSPGYTRLKKSLSKYQYLAAKYPDGLTSFDSVLELKKLLLDIGDLKNLSQKLAIGIKQFQRRHGIKPTGEINADTQAILKLGFNKKIEIIKKNLDRWRKMPRFFGKKYITVNIPNYNLALTKNKKTALRMKIAVGKDYRKTPTMVSNIDSITINPLWTVPSTIFAEDLLPKFKEDPQFFIKKGYYLANKEGKQIYITPEIWNTIRQDDILNYRIILKQSPSLDNPLGKIRFNMKNKQSIFFHGTNNPSIFEQESRAVSSGCIRLESPLELLKSILPELDQTEHALSLYESSAKNLTLKLKKPIPAVLLYLTAWVTPDNMTHFRRDIYQKDYN